MGYSVVRSAYRDEDGWRISPLFADTIEIAVLLYQVVFDEVASIDPLAPIVFDVPCADKEHSAALQMIPAKIDEYLARGYRHKLPSMYPLNKVFCM